MDAGAREPQHRGMFHIPRVSRTRGRDAARGTRSPRTECLGGSPALEDAELVDDRLRLVAQPIVDLRSEEVVAEEVFPLMERSRAERPSGRVVDLDNWLV